MKKTNPEYEKTVLIVDDSPGIRLLIKAYLEPEKYRVIQATDAETALSLCKKERIDLIILDMMLPGNIMGNDVLVRLRKKYSTTRIPVIMISGLVAFQDGLQTIDQDVVFLPKPFSKDQLMQTMVGCVKTPHESI